MTIEGIMLSKYTHSLRYSVYLFILFDCVIFGEGFLVSDGLQRVQTQFGEIVGHIGTAKFDNKVYQHVEFLGIPYAEPPIGDLRYRKPVPIKKMPTPFAAHKYGPSCLQRSYRGFKNTSEDCLYLNVFVPSNAGDIGIVRKAVMVYIHGGGFVIGSGDTSLGVLSAFTDTIGVTINYRLGALGFLSTQDKHGPGNYGLWDQHVAIQWVKDNIASFGGDANNITIFGESAGSSSVIYQTLYPGSKGVISRAIGESGTLAAWGSTPKQVNYDRSQTFAASLNCNSSNHEQMMNCLRRVSGQDIETALLNYENSDNYITADIIPSWVPVYDGEFVMVDPRSIISELNKPDSASKFASYYGIDLLLGMNNYDGGVYAGYLQHISNLSLSDVDGLTTSMTDKIIHDVAIPAFLGLAGLPQTPLFCDAVMNEYTNWQNTTDGEGRVEKVLQMITDLALRAPSIALANQHSDSKSKTYVYQFSVESELGYARLPSFIHGANHADELAYVFGLSEKLVQYVMNSKGAVITEDHIRLSAAMMTMWSNFAKSGNPNFPVSVSTDVSISWPAYGRQDQPFLEIRLSQSEVGTRLGARGVAFWNNLLPAWQALTNTTHT